MSIDFEKCFDRIEHQCIYGALEFFGFGNNFIRMVQTTYNEFSACVQCNGNFSPYFNVTCSVHQGGPNSSYLFLLCAELLAILIRSDQNLEGIQIGNLTSLLSQFADDMDVSLKAKQENLDRLFQILDEFKGIFGFQVNYNKTSVYRVGSIKKTNAQCYSAKKIEWTNGPLNILGVLVNHDPQKVFELNFTPLKEKAQGILRRWSRRSLSLLGKVQVVNTLVVSLFIYRMFVLPTPPNTFY